MNYLGISAYYHNSAAALVNETGLIMFAAEEERFSRQKNDAGFPVQAIRHALNHCKLAMQHIDKIVFYEDPYRKAIRVINTLKRRDDRPFVEDITNTLSDFILKRLGIRRHIKSVIDQFFRTNYNLNNICYIDHHLAHASSALFTSPYETTDVLCVDSVGESETTSFWSASGNRLKKLHSIEYPHSIGLFYSTVTAYLGFKVNHGEYKVMGMAAYGTPKFAGVLQDNVININENTGDIQLNMDFFEFDMGRRMYSDKLESLLGFSPRLLNTRVTQDQVDLASSVQHITDLAITACCNYMHRITKCRNLSLAGGVALNCVANSKLIDNTGYDNLWVMPAAGDAGGAIGAACWGVSRSSVFDQKTTRFDLNTMYLGPQMEKEEIEAFLVAKAINYRLLDDKALFGFIASELANGSVVGWASGRMEFGPRALGNRSILADPRRGDMQEMLNNIIKRRESFRPFAPVIKEDCFAEWFIGQPNRFMTSVVKVINRPESIARYVDCAGRQFKIDSQLSAVTHVDGTARVQTVSPQNNRRLYALLDKFEKITGVPVLLNTSFNTSNMPIVCGHEDALACFLESGIHILCLGNYVITR